MKQLPAVAIWAIAFAFVESSVVEYLRAIYYPLNQGGFQFPLQTLEQLTAMGSEHYRRLMIELGRELATLIMLASLGAAAANNVREAWAHFMAAFGIWDIFYYVWLKVFIGWPTSLFDWDLLFLIPLPWVGPVIAPIIISLVLIFAGVIILIRENSREPLIASWSHWALFVLGGILAIAAFTWDYRNIMAGGLPNPFRWDIFILGVAIGLGSFLHLDYYSKSSARAKYGI